MTEGGMDVTDPLDALDCGPDGCSITQGMLTSAQLESGDVFEAMEAYFERGWTDGLPIVPPTPGRVATFLDAGGVAPAEVLARIPTRENIEITAEKVAINAVMAGARPEYMPVIVAGMRALGNPNNNMHTHTATASGAAFLVIVNGPIRRELDINCGRGLFGPGRRANATIGRALRLVVRNVARSVHGEFDQALWSQPGRYTWCFGEHEETDHGWPTLSEDAGFSRESNTVTIYPFMGYRQAQRTHTRDPDELLRTLAYSARNPAAPAGGPEDTGRPTIYGLPDKEFHDAVYNDFAPRRTHLFVLGSNCLEVLGRLGKQEARERLFAHMTEQHPALQPVAIERPDLVSMMCVDVEGGAYVFTPHPPTNQITEAVQIPPAAVAPSA